jgi:hypothetical protein
VLAHGPFLVRIFGSGRTKRSDPNSVKAILLVAGLLGFCNAASADLASDTFLKIRVENYFRNPLAFPEPGFDIIAAAEPLSREGGEVSIGPDDQREILQRERWATAPGKEGAIAQDDRAGAWWAISSLCAFLLLGACVSAAGSRRPRVRRRRHSSQIRRRHRVKTTIRMMSYC